MATEPWMIAAVAGAAAVFAGRRLLGGRRVPAQQLRAWLAEGAVVVDVRSADEFGGGAYPGALNIPVHQLGARMGEIPRGRRVILYCASGLRSGMAAAMLRRAGFAEVVNAGSLGDMPR